VPQQHAARIELLRLTGVAASQTQNTVPSKLRDTANGGLWIAEAMAKIFDVSNASFSSLLQSYISDFLRLG